MIKCEICKKCFKQVTNTHLKSRHNMTVEEYILQFPDSPLQDESIKMKGNKNPFFGRRHSSELKERMSKHFSKKRVSEETKKKISITNSNQNGKLQKTMSTNVYREKMSVITKNYWKSDISQNHREKNRCVFRKTREIFDDKIRAIQNTDDYKKKLSNSIKKYWTTQTQEDKNRRVQKQFSTLKKNSNNQMISKGEELLYNKLLYYFEKIDIQRQVWIKNPYGKMWNFDFYIKSIDTYIQFDGVYWHGLDRPIETIAEGKTKRDKVIYKKWLTDQAQNSWANCNQKRLIRITDAEFKQNSEKCMLKILL